MKIILDTFYDFESDLLITNKSYNIIGGSWMKVLYDRAKEQNIEVILARDYILKGEFASDDLILSEGYTHHTDALIAGKANPFLVYSGESPNVDWKFYSNIKKHTTKYKNLVLFSGTKKFVAATSNFYPFLWPNTLDDLKKAKNILPEVKSKQLVMVVSNKKQSSSSSGKLVIKYIKSLLLTILTNLPGPVKLKDLYGLRMKAIVYFSDKTYFDLFGKGWERQDNLNNAEKSAIDKLQPQPVNNKQETLADYNFALCFENCVYPGYITEKIFDCFFSKCIPVYYGAPNIEDYVPANTFVNASNFKNFEELDNFLKTVTDEQIMEYKRNIEKYLAGDDVLKFTDKAFADNILSIIAKLPFNN